MDGNQPQSSRIPSLGLFMLKNVHLRYVVPVSVNFAESDAVESNSFCVVKHHSVIEDLQ